VSAAAFPRGSGLILPISALPNQYGIGTFGESAYRFVDFLEKAGQSYWQILPLSPTGFGDSPYQSCSARAGNPYFIDFDMLCAVGILAKEDYAFADFGQDPDSVDYGKVYEHRFPVLRRAYERGRVAFAGEYKAFCAENAYWLDDYALFMAIKQRFGMAALSEWPDEGIRRREQSALITYTNLLAEEMEFQRFLQWLFFWQWSRLKAYAEKKGVGIIGDLPIYVAEDSVEVWAHPELFRLKEPGVPSVCAGVPPDFYSATGQLWGNPVYDWEHHKKTGYAWWLGRLKAAAELYDVIRIDHFRAVHNYWAVPHGETTAEDGHWEPGPGMAFIHAIRQELPHARFIAEDLGDMDKETVAFIHSTGFPGMAVAVYAFNPDASSPYLPHNITPARAAYTSTHDSPTFVEWLSQEAGDGERAFAFDYMRLRIEEGIGWGVVKSVWGSPACIAVAQMQDVLGLGADARMNTPSTLGGRNWRWRIRAEALNDTVAAMLRRVTQIYGRLPAAKKPAADAPAAETGRENTQQKEKGKL
jgi:4-alpha-glucanotransferase